MGCTPAALNDIARMQAEIERLRAALRRCREMVGHPDNIAFIDATLGELNERRLRDSEKED